MKLTWWGGPEDGGTIEVPDGVTYVRTARLTDASYRLEDKGAGADPWIYREVDCPVEGRFLIWRP